jgi:hypothetical protein
MAPQGARALEPLAAVAAASRGAADGVAGLLAGAPPADAAAALAAALAPVEAELARYGDLEAAALVADLASRAPPGPPPRLSSVAGATDAAAALAALAAAARAAVTAGRARCADLTGGSGVPALARAADASLARSLTLAADGLVAAGAALAGEGGGGGGGAAALAAQLLPLATAAAGVAASVAGVGADLKADAAITLTRLLAAARAPAPLPGTVPHASHAARVRALLATPDGRADLEGTVEGAWAPLPAASAAAAALVAAARGAVRRVLLVDAISAVAGVAGLPVWTADGGGGGGGGDAAADTGLTFSAYPQAWATGAGEAVLALPASLVAALEAAAGVGGTTTSPDAPAGDDDAGVWLDEAAADAAGALLAELGRLDPATLSPSGAAQLAADASYLASVFRTLGAPAGEELAALAARCGGGGGVGGA